MRIFAIAVLLACALAAQRIVNDPGRPASETYTRGATAPKTGGSPIPTTTTRAPAPVTRSAPIPTIASRLPQPITTRPVPVTTAPTPAPVVFDVPQAYPYPYAPYHPYGIPIVVEVPE